MADATSARHHRPRTDPRRMFVITSIIGGGTRLDKLGTGTHGHQLTHAMREGQGGNPGGGGGLPRTLARP